MFIEQDQNYINEIILQDTKKVAIEAARGLEWYRLADVVIGMDTFGASAPAKELFEKFGYTVEAILEKLN
nr:hypothetical protein [Sulfurimonas sediminis]